MTPNTYRTEDYLRHMLEAIRRIAAYLQGFDRSSFDRDSRTQDAVIRNLEVISEPARNVLRRDPAFVAAHPEIPWSLAYRTRNALSHGTPTWISGQSGIRPEPTCRSSKTASWRC